MKIILVLAALLFQPLLALNAQERAAGSAIDIQTTWTALKLLAEQADIKAQGALSLGESIDNAIRKCGQKSMVYAPGGSGADADNCINSSGDLLTTTSTSGGSKTTTIPRTPNMVAILKCSSSDYSSGGSSNAPSGSASASIRLGTPSGWVTVAKDSDTCSGSNGDNCTASASASVNIFEKNGVLYKYSSAAVTPNGIAVMDVAKLMDTSKWDGRAELKGKSCSTSVSRK